MKSADYFSDIGFDNGDFTLRTNSAWLDTQGVETQIKYQPNQHWLVNFQYSYTENEGSWKRQIFEDGSINYHDWSKIIPTQMGSLTAGYFFSSGFEASFMLYYQDEVHWEQGNFADDYHRVDIRLAKRIPMQHSEILLELIAQNIFDETYTEFHHLNQYGSRYLLRLGARF